MAKEKTNYIFALLAMVAIVAIVALILLFSQSKGTTYTTTLPEIQQATQVGEKNIAGEANWAGYCLIYANQFNRYMDGNPSLALAYREAYYANNCEEILG